MKDNKLIIQTALASLLAIATTPLLASDIEWADSGDKVEKCAGVAKKA